MPVFHDFDTEHLELRHEDWAVDVTYKQLVVGGGSFDAKTGQSGHTRVDFPVTAIRGIYRAGDTLPDKDVSIGDVYFRFKAADLTFGMPKKDDQIVDGSETFDVRSSRKTLLENEVICDVNKVHER